MRLGVALSLGLLSLSHAPPRLFAALAAWKPPNRKTPRRLAPTENAERIREYLEHKPKGKFGTHGYAPEAWSFDALEFHGRLGPYLEHDGVALE